MAGVSPTVERLLADGKLAEAGREAGHEIQARRAKTQPRRGNRRSDGVWHMSHDWHPSTPKEFMRGGMAKLEHIAGHRARDEAICLERECWLPRLEGWLAVETNDLLRQMLATEIKRQRRTLGISPGADHVRALTRARVAKWPHERA